MIKDEWSKRQVRPVKKKCSEEEGKKETSNDTWSIRKEKVG
jgi:hypothetical protein